MDNISDTELLDWVQSRKADVQFINHMFGEYIAIRFDVSGRIFTIAEQRVDTGLRTAIQNAIQQEQAYLHQLKHDR